MAEGGGVEPPSGSFPERWFSGPESVAVASRPPMEWEPGLEPGKSCFANSRLVRFGISHMAHPRGIEPRIAVLEAATVTVRSGAWYSRQESNLHVDARFERAASTDSATGVELVGRGRLELPCTGRLVLSEVCLPDSTTGPCPGRASNPQNCGSQPQASADCATWTSWCAR